MSRALAIVSCLIGFTACGQKPPMGGSGGSAGAGASGAAGGTAGSGGSGGACGAGKTLRPGETTATLDVGGQTRSYLLHVPPAYDGSAPVPLVLDFHAILTTGAIERTLDNYATVADAKGFIVAYPDGIDNAWNIGPCCTFSRSVDDLSFARALVRELEHDGCIDEKRVYAVGYSMGGGMSHFLACNAADVFAAVAPAAFDLLEEMPCAPSRGITNIMFRGTADPIVPYAGGASNPPNGLQTTIHFLGALNTFAKWAELNRCAGSAATDGAGCQTYTQCRDGSEVTLCTANGGGHVPADAAAAWQTLSRHALP